MRRREMLKTTLASGLVIAWSGGISLAKEYFPVEVDDKLFVGNEPAGTVTFRSKGYAEPAARFTVKLDNSLRGC